MKLVYLIVLAVGLTNVAAARYINEKHLNREFLMCGLELFAALRRICGIHGYDPEAKYTPDQTQSIEKMCCAKKCKVMDVVTRFCKNARYWDDRRALMDSGEEDLPSTTRKTTTRVPMKLSVVKMPTATEKLASIWFITG